jgi:hypothetical protein
LLPDHEQLALADENIIFTFSNSVRKNSHTTDGLTLFHFYGHHGIVTILVNGLPVVGSLLKT